MDQNYHHLTVSKPETQREETLYPSYSERTGHTGTARPMGTLALPQDPWDLAVKSAASTEKPAAGPAVGTRTKASQRCSESVPSALCYPVEPGEAEDEQGGSVSDFLIPAADLGQQGLWILSVYCGTLQGI